MWRETIRAKQVVIIYTFRTNPFKEKIIQLNQNTFIFGKLKEDFKIISKRIREERPEYIIGIANFPGKSKCESRAVNKFTKNKKIEKRGEESFNLFFPENASFEISKSVSDSFCNWTMYKISKLIKDEKLNSKLIFVHLNEKDFQKFLDFLSHEAFKKQKKQITKEEHNGKSIQRQSKKNG